MSNYDNMNFSVLISIYSKENPDFFKQALDSVFCQSLMPSEVILVKDGPLTPILDAVINDYGKSYSKILKVVTLDQNMGLGYALNEGLKHCTTEWVARMDTDDICYPNRFEKQVEMISRFPNVSFFGAFIAEFETSTDKIVAYRKLPEFHEDIIKYAKTRCPMNHVTLIYKRQVVEALGGYREFPEDYHLWVRALMKGYKFYNIQEPLVYVRFNLDAIKRRGGFNYIFTELKHQKEFYKLGFLSFSEYIKNTLVRLSVRLMPSFLRMQIYSKILRTKS